VLLAAAYRLVGPRWSLLLDPLLGVGAVCLLFLIGGAFLRGSEEKGHLGVFLATLALATLPLLNRLALHGDTHVPATVCVLGGIWLLLEWDREPTRRRAFLTGAVWGILPSVRYGEAVMSVAAFSFLALRSRRRSPPRANHLGAAAVGALIPMLFQAAYDTLAFGSPWRTGYAPTHEQTAFSLSAIPENVRFYASALGSDPDVGLYVAVGLLALAFMILDRDVRAFGVFLLSAFTLSVLEYSSYYWGALEAPALALRFFLPAVVVLGVAIAWMAARSRGRVRPLFVSALVGLTLLGAVRSEVEMRNEGLALEGARTVVEATRQAVPAGSVLIASRTLGETLLFADLWHVVPQWLLPGDPERDLIIVPWEVPPEVVREYSESDAPRTVQVNRSASLRNHYRGLRGEDLVSAVFSDIHAWHPNADVYWIGDPRVVETVNGFLSHGAFQLLGEVELEPVPPGRPDSPLPYWVPLPPLFIFRLVPSEG